MATVHGLTACFACGSTSGLGNKGGHLGSLRMSRVGQNGALCSGSRACRKGIDGARRNLGAELSGAAIRQVPSKPGIQERRYAIQHSKRRKECIQFLPQCRVPRCLRERRRFECLELNPH